MTNFNNSDSDRREVRRDTYQDAQGNLHTNVTQTTEHPPQLTRTDLAYRNGYTTGRVREREQWAQEQEVRDNDNAARGLLLGILLTSLVGLTVGALALLSQRREAPAPAAGTAPAPRVVPASPSPSPVLSPSPAPSNRETTVIERVVPVPQQRTVERVVPVPQPVPASPAPDTTQNQLPATGSTTAPQGTSGNPTSTDSTNPAPGATNSGTAGNGTSDTGTDAGTSGQ